MPDLEALDRLMGPRTRLVCVTHASNMLGTINPIREIADFVHARGAQICVDGVAYAPHRAIDVQALDVDYYVFSLYKTYGPHHAVMYGRHELLLELDGLYHYFYGKDKVPGKLEPGNPNYELAWGSAGIVDYLETLGGGEGRAGDRARFDDIAATRPASANGCCPGCARATTSASSASAARRRRCACRPFPSPSRARLRAISSAASTRRRSACAMAISTRGA